MVSEVNFRMLNVLTASITFLYLANYIVKYDNKDIGMEPVPAASWKSYVEIMKKMGKEP